MAKAKRAALYLRVSTGEQTTENQRLALRQEAERRGWNVVHEYEDAGISGAKGRDKRPGLDSMLKDARRGRFDVVMCWSLDRLGRSLAHLIGTAQELHDSAVDLFMLQSAIDTTTPAGRVFFAIMGAFAEFERETIRSRVKAGIARRRAQGKRLGRPRAGQDVEDRIRATLATGKGIVATAKACGVGVSIVQRVKRESAPAPEALAA